MDQFGSKGTEHPSQQADCIILTTRYSWVWSLFFWQTATQRVYASLVLHVPLFSLFTFPLVRFDNQLNEGEVFTEALCLLPIADFRGGSCVVTCGLRTKLLCWRLVLSPGAKFWKNKVRTWLGTHKLCSERGSNNMSKFILWNQNWNGLALQKLSGLHKRSALHLRSSQRWRSSRIWDVLITPQRQAQKAEFHRCIFWVAWELNAAVTAVLSQF